MKTLNPESEDCGEEDFFLHERLESFLEDPEYYEEEAKEEEEDE